MLQRTLPAGSIAPCLPTKTTKLPSGSLWLHEIKHDGFRVIARKHGDRVRLYSRPGNDLTRRFPLIVETLARLRSRYTTGIEGNRTVNTYTDRYGNTTGWVGGKYISNATNLIPKPNGSWASHSK
jgi:hypothetical protein